MDRYLSAGLRPKKGLGQNFLVDEEVVADLVAAANLTKEDAVLEVGAGTGVLTKELAKRAGKVFAFELDRDLIPILKKEFQESNNIEVVNKDFLKTSPARYVETPRRGVSTLKIVGSIPYQITSPLIHKLLTLEPKPTLVVLLIQKEVAEKITAKPPKATYLSNIIKLLGNVEIVRFVPKTAFWPVPEVGGAIIKIVCSCDPCGRPSGTDVEDFQKFLHRGFQNPRKMLRHKFDTEVLESCNIEPARRSQTLELDEWFKLLIYGRFVDAEWLED